jgi:hypothetical protein
MQFTVCARRSLTPPILISNAWLARRKVEALTTASAEPGSRSNLSSNRASAGSTPAGLAQLVTSDSERWADIVKQTDFNPSV